MADKCRCLVLAPIQSSLCVCLQPVLSLCVLGEPVGSTFRSTDGTTGVLVLFIALLRNNFLFDKPVPPGLVVFFEVALGLLGGVIFFFKEVLEIGLAFNQEEGLFLGGVSGMIVLFEFSGLVEVLALAALLIASSHFFWL